MHNITFLLKNDIVLRITSNTPLIFEKKEQLLSHAYIPGIKNITFSSSQKAHFTITHTESNRTHVTDQTFGTHIQQTWNKTIPLDAYHLLYAASRIHRAQQSLFSVHAACIEHTKNTLLVGHTGHGKTTITQKLLKDARAKLFSGNKTVISCLPQRLIATSGTKTITTKKSRTGIAYQNRSASSLQKQKISRKQTLAIDQTIIIRINSEDHAELLKPEEALHRLYPFFLDAVNADVLLNRGAYLFDGSIDYKIRSNLSETLGAALENTPTYLITGSPTFITKKIKNL